MLAGVVLLVTFGASGAAPYAAMVMDARSGEVLYSRNADSRLHPASLTKMMTLYVAFEAIRLGEIGLDTTVTVSRNAAAEPPSKLGLRAGQRIQMRYLIRAAAVKSANDAATAIGEAISGSEAAFARRMNRTAQALGMTRSTFKNANGLTEEGHLSTARDMTILGRRLFYDYPQYYNIFSRRSTNAGGTEVANTNRRFLDSYAGADGIKTGYTRAAGFNLVASAERGSERIIATVFGGESTANRNAMMAELLDLGFDRAPTRVAANPPPLPRYDAPPAEAPAEVVVAGGALPAGQLAGKIVRISGQVSRSLRPQPRGASAEPPEALLAAIESDVATAIAGVASEAAAREVAAADAARAAATEAAEAVALAAAEAAPEAPPGPVQLAEVAAPPPRPEDHAEELAEADLPAGAAATEPVVAAAGFGPPAPVPDETAGPAPAPGLEPEILVASAAGLDAAGVGAEEVPSLVAASASAPVSAGPPRMAEPQHDPALAIAGETASIRFAAAEPPVPAVPEPVLRPEPESAEVVTRLSTSNGRLSGITLGRYPSRYEAEKVLIAMAIADTAGLGQALRRVVQRNGGFEANFMGLGEVEASRACQRIAARGVDCDTIGG